ncbi:MAG: GvpL/GvpF family gas vesicle protein [Hadesarchaea archaeon]|nr:GvpL/GvpF family gas vesicle protein [Hadesarchaea archaeon]
MSEAAPKAEIGEGRYLYCIISSSAELTLGEIGIEDNKVYTIPCKDIGAVVHVCPAKAYESKDEEKVKEWIFAHQYVIDQATKKFGTVLPFTFDSIVKGSDEVVKDWMDKEYPKLKQELERLKDKSEYTVQIFCDESLLVKKVEEKNEKIRKLREEIKTKSKGTAYLLERKLEGMMKDAVVAEANNHAKNFHDQIKEYADEVKVGKPTKQVPEKWKDKLMVLNLSCLMHEEKVDKLGEVLAEIDKSEGFSVRFTGPWAPFSFARLEGKK